MSVKALWIAALVVLVVCSIDSAATAAPVVSQAGTQEESLDLYRAIIQVSTSSPWTNVYLTDGAKIANWKLQVLSGSNAPGLRYGVDVGKGTLLYVTKNQGDMTNVTIEVTFVVTNIAGSNPIYFLIQKGSLGVTKVDLYNFNNDRSFVTSFINNGQGSSGFSTSPESLARGGPLNDPFQGPSRLVWAQYYPLWSNAGGQGWADPKFKDNPLLNLNDRECIVRQIRMAKSAGIDGFIVSWWWNKDLTPNSVLPTLLDAAAQENFKVTIYFPAIYNGTYSLPMSNQDLLRMFRGFFSNYEHDQRYFMIDGRPVIFVYAADAEPLGVWRTVFSTLSAEGHSAFYVGETERAKPEYLEVFDGIHVYLPGNEIQGGTLDVLYSDLQSATRSYGLLHPEAPAKLWAATLVPGFDDSLLNRGKVQIIPRNDGGTYRQTFDVALRSNPDWILITSFNEWYENSHIEPSINYGWEYGNLTLQFSINFKQGLNPLAPQRRTGSPPAASAGLSSEPPGFMVSWNDVPTQVSQAGRQKSGPGLPAGKFLHNLG